VVLEDHIRLNFQLNNKKILQGQKPEYFNELLKKINQEKADIIAFSIVYSSQAHYGYALLKELKNTSKAKIILGGPAVNSKLTALADKYLKNEVELLEYIEEKKIPHEKLTFNYAIDFTQYNLKAYFTPNPVLPIRTSSTCYYKQCTFCDHYNKVPYYEYTLENIEKTLKQNIAKHYFLIDDMIPPRRLLELSKLFKKYEIKFACQLKPTKQFGEKTLQTLSDNGLKMVIWGVESGNQRILDLMKKGTNVQDVNQVLIDAHNSGIKNVLYIMFGFPTETKTEFLDTIQFLKNNNKNIDLISTATFGLQTGTPIYKKPSAFGINNITEKERTLLDKKISYTVETGLSQKEASKLAQNHKKTIENINKYPKSMNFFRGHMLCNIFKE